METLNEYFMHSPKSKSDIKNGLTAVSKTILFPGIVIYRFANTQRPDLYNTGSWWVSFSPFESLKNYSESRQQSLAITAHQCLAIDPQWSNGKKVNVLVKAQIKQKLSAWSGTPKTQVSKILVGFNKYLTLPLKPHRNITQLYIPGLGEPDPNDSNRKIWESAFIGPWRIYI
ncbi:MAG: hypothetical protein DRH50_08005 [Deltaproteobacteria bacterium]|nr:MAG: hypothetical protein DRH50_08005 [Deltaproteobacteria bacterium]